MKKQPKQYGHPDLLTRAELAERLFVSVSTVDKWTREGFITAIHHPVGPGHGRPVYYDWDTVEREIASPAFRPTPQR